MEQNNYTEFLAFSKFEIGVKMGPQTPADPKLAFFHRAPTESVHLGRKTLPFGGLELVWTADWSQGDSEPSEVQTQSCSFVSAGSYIGALYQKNDVGSAGVWGPICFWNCKLWKSQKLRKKYVASWGTCNFTLHFQKIIKVFIFMISGPGGNVQDPQKPLIVTVTLQKYFNKCKKLKLRKYLKMRVPKILEIRPIRSWKSWIWDKYLHKTWNGQLVMFSSTKGI